MPGQPESLRATELYWNQLVQLKASTHCIRLQRNKLGRMLRHIKAVNAIATNGGIASWLIWKDFPILWASVLAASQALSALQPVFPIAKDHKQASELHSALEMAYLDAEDDWEKISSGLLSVSDILSRRTKLRRLQLSVEQRHFPEGIEFSSSILGMANAATIDFFKSTFNQDVTS